MAHRRVIGVSIPDVRDWRQPLPEGKWSRFFAGIATQFDLVDVAHPVLTRAETYLNLARSFRPDSRSWRAQAAFNPRLAAKRTQAVQDALERRAGSYELIVQLQTLCAPGVERSVPYVIYTDNTLALTQRLYPLPLSAHDSEARMAYEAKISQEAEVVFTMSEYARRSMVDDYGCSPERVAVVGAGTNQMLPELGAKDYAVPSVIFVGMDFARKGGDVLLQAWPLVRKEVPAAELIVAGPSRRPRTPLPDGVQWLGRVDRARLDDLYRSASVFTMPSLFEPWGFVFYEAMGYGLPCVSTSCCAIPEIVQDGVTGSLVPPGDAPALAAALITLLSDPEKTAAMGRAAHLQVLQGLSWNDVAQRIALRLEQA
jgi:glycosyltransferase involved in cell wall biosynthesis